MGLRELIDQPVQIIEKIVEEGSEKYKFRGTSNGAVLTDCLLTPKPMVEQLARHWSTVTENIIPEDMVKHIKCVHATLVAEEWDEVSKTWNEVEPYDITEVANFSVRKGPTFLLMIGAAYECLGLSPQEGEKADKVNSTVSKVAAGNSEKPQDSK